MNRKKEMLVLGFALFAMFFGAGNLLFPPSLGVTVGTNWFTAGIGFFLTESAVKPINSLVGYKAQSFYLFSLVFCFNFIDILIYFNYNTIYD